MSERMRLCPECGQATSVYFVVCNCGHQFTGGDRIIQATTAPDRPTATQHPVVARQTVAAGAQAKRCPACGQVVPLPTPVCQCGHQFRTGFVAPNLTQMVSIPAAGLPNALLPIPPPGPVDSLIQSGAVQGAPNRHLALKICLALIPAIIFTQDYAWMTLNAYLELAFLSIWALMIWSAFQLSERNRVIERFLILTEIGLFMLPLSAIVFTIAFGSREVSSAAPGAEQTGAALGTMLGGTFAVAIGFVIGLAGGVITHLVASQYTRRAEAGGVGEAATTSNKHGIVISLLAVILLAIFLGSFSRAREASTVAQSQQPSDTGPRHRGFGWANP